MSWNYRTDGSWVSTTAKKMENGAWIETGAGPRRPSDAPSHGDGKNVGALSNQSASEWAGTLNDIRDYGAAMDGSTDDAAAIQQAMEDSTADGAAAYIPADAGVAGISDQVMMTPSMNGATLVGDGYDSETRHVGDGIREGFRIPDSISSAVTVTLANFRHNGNYPTVDRQHWGMELGRETTVSGNDVLVENVWIHDCESSCVQVEMDGVTFRNVTAWNTNTWHGFSARGNNPSGNNRSRFERCFVWGCEQYGFDTSGLSQGDITVSESVSVENGYGAKATNESTDARYVNCLFADNNIRGFNTTGSGGGSVHLENVVARNNGQNPGGEQPQGIAIYDMNDLTGTNIYTVNNGGNGLITWDDGTTVTYDVDLIEACNNDLYGFQVVNSATGSIGTIRGQGNGNGLTGGTASISVGSTESGSCSVPDVIPDLP